MGRPARAETCPYDQVNVVHCVNRCVRRGYLCGQDAVTGRNFEHRRGWIRARLEFLAGAMAIEVLGYAVMSNHFHVILRNRPDIVENLSDREVALRWWQLCPQRRNEDGTPAEPTEFEINAWTIDRERNQELRRRLSDVSWFMRFVAGDIATRANREDEVTGRFWEGRFKCQPLLDEAAILTCMQYVDLNPVRAGIAATPENSDFTSAQDRISDYQHAVSSESMPAEKADDIQFSSRQTRARADQLTEHGPRAGWLQPVSLDPPRKRVRQRHTGRRNSNDGFLDLSISEYLALLDWTGRQIRRDGKCGTIPSRLAPILERLHLDAEIFVDSVRQFRRWHSSGVGRPASLERHLQRTGRNRSLNAALSRRTFA